MRISVSELKANAGKYVMMAVERDIFITKNNKQIAKLTTARIDKMDSAKALIGALPGDMDYDEQRKERISN